MRLSSPSMAAAVSEGAADGGADVLDLGLVGTEMVYFAVGELGLDGGIIVTASHNPKQYTGMKIVRRGALPVGGESGLLDVRDRAVAADWRDAARGEIREEDIWDRFVDRVLSFVDVDVAEAAARRDRRRQRDGRRDAAARARPAADGRRRPLLLRARRHVPEPRAEPAAAGEPRVHRRQDARRAAPTSASRSTATRTAASSSTTRGEFVPGDFITALFAESILGQGARRQGDLRRARFVGGAGGDRARRRRAARQPRRARVHQAAYARGGRRLRRRGLGALLLPRLLAGRLGHDPVPADVRAGLAPRQAERGARAAAATRYFITGEINTPVADVPCKLQELEDRFGPEGTVTHLDGLSVMSDDWHFNVRPSNTEPLLRLNLEARSQELMDRKARRSARRHPRVSLRRNRVGARHRLRGARYASSRNS